MANILSSIRVLQVGTIPRGRNVAFNAVFKNADTFSFQGSFRALSSLLASSRLPHTCVIHPDDIGEAVIECCRVIPHGVLCFFPSYGLLERVVERWKATQLWDRLCSVKHVFIGRTSTSTLTRLDLFSDLALTSEPRQKGQGDFDTLIKRYYAIVKRGGSPSSQTSPAPDNAQDQPVHSLRGRRERAGDARNGADSQAHTSVANGTTLPCFTSNQRARLTTRENPKGPSFSRSTEARSARA
jgi:hypothetical protein